MDNFEKAFNKLYPKNVSRRIKLIAHAQSHIERLEKEKIASPETFNQENELVKWIQVLTLLHDKEPMEKIDAIVLSNIFPKFP